MLNVQWIVQVLGLGPNVALLLPLSLRVRNGESFFAFKRVDQNTKSIFSHKLYTQINNCREINLTTSEIRMDSETKMFMGISRDAIIIVGNRWEDKSWLYNNLALLGAKGKVSWKVLDTVSSRSEGIQGLAANKAFEENSDARARRAAQWRQQTQVGCGLARGQKRTNRVGPVRDQSERKVATSDRGSSRGAELIELWQAIVQRESNSFWQGWVLRLEESVPTGTGWEEQFPTQCASILVPLPKMNHVLGSEKK